jgi:hypothetical protein|nr:MULTISPECIES: hypothetical protein [Akkermansia]
MEVVLVDNGSYLFELVGFGFSIGAGLDVNNLWDLFMPGDHMGTSSLPELKMEMGEQFGCFFKSDVPCFVRVHDFFQKLFLAAHVSILPFLENQARKIFLNLEI